jgi:hypothetical protein
MEKTIKVINDSLPEHWTLIDCRKKPLVGRMFGKRDNCSSWCIKTPRKVYWFRSISAIYRFTDKAGYTSFSKGNKVTTRTDDYITYSEPKRICYAKHKGLLHCILPVGNTWRFRQNGACNKSKAAIETFTPTADYYFEKGKLILADKKVIKSIANECNWRAEEVSFDTLLVLQKNGYPS